MTHIPETKKNEISYTLPCYIGPKKRGNNKYGY